MLSAVMGKNEMAVLLRGGHSNINLQPRLTGQPLKSSRFAMPLSGTSGCDLLFAAPDS
jgi:hypothetical protein